MHHCTIEEELDEFPEIVEQFQEPVNRQSTGRQPQEPVNRQPLQPVNRPPLQPVNMQPLQQVSLNFSEVEQFWQPVNQRQLVAAHPAGPRFLQQPHEVLDSSSNPIRPQKACNSFRRPATHSGGLPLIH